MAEDSKPTVRRRVLGTNLRRLREERGLLLEHAAEHLSCNASKISRIESGRSPVRPLDLKALLDLYGVLDQGAREGWLSLAREGRRQRWWRALEDQLPRDFLDLIGLEEDTSYCRGFQPAIIDGLLQTERYAEAVIGGGSPGPLQPNQETMLKVRLERQKALTRTEHPIEVWMVMGEAALRQMCGGPEVMRAQLHHLLELANLGNVTLQVLPFSVGAYRGGPFPFKIYRFPMPSEMEVVLLESHMSHAYLENPRDIAFHSEIFDRLRATALGELDSRRMIEGIAREYARESRGDEGAGGDRLGEEQSQRAERGLRRGAS
ncbi:helix-turn-helix domain-containing protein [Streptomyces calidiresistens]|uniref:Helix-turn-helix domain-containing protein n=2 Tax=Streptomyces TaxID=1883 RepID=A0A7W3Y1R2_9ACTN|nr:helix-turn-helix transcriptional regulator [Streptomyces calidiresistens]MBB0230831.1 helix-turn-helix domain-containing protein [Streptomyces calidiresistens]MBB0244572.1 helix-turn-helix domain-containing protein [Streptomyces alkaliphilus]